MAAIVQSSKMSRLEDLIAVIENGTSLKVEVQLRRLIAGREGPPEEADFMADDTEVYLLIADYIIDKFGEQKNIVSKVYMLGATAESSGASSRNTDIANKRLNMDYDRLKNAGIVFEERYFSELT